MAFSTQKFFFNVSDMNEPADEQLCNEACVTMQTYNAAIDDRSWAMDDVLQSKFFEGLLVCDMVEVSDVEGSRDETFLRDDNNRYGDLEPPSTSGRRKDKKQRTKGKRGRGSDGDGSLDSDTGRESQPKKIKTIRDDGKDKTSQKLRKKDKSKSWDDDKFGDSDSFETSSDIEELKNKGKSKPSKDRRDSNNRIYDDKEYNGSDNKLRRSKSKPKGKETGQGKPGSKEDRTGNKETHRDRDNKHVDQKKELGSRDGRKTDGKNSRLDDTKGKDRDSREKQRQGRSKDYKVEDQERDPRSGNDKRDKDNGTGKYDSEDDDDDRIVKKKAGQVRDNQDGDQKKEPSSRDVKRTDGKDSKFDVTKDRDRDGRERQRQRRSKDYKVQDQERDPRSGNDKRDKDKGTGKYDSEDDDRIVKKKAGQVRDKQDGYQKQEPSSRDVKRTDGKDSRLDETKGKDRDRTERRSKDYKVGDKQRDLRSGNDKRDKYKGTGKYDSDDDEDRIVKKKAGQVRDKQDGDQKKEPGSKDVRRTDGKDSGLDETIYEDRNGRERQRQRRLKDYKVQDQERDPRSGNDKRDKDRGTGKYDSEDDDRIVKKKAGQVDSQDVDQKKEPSSRDVKRTDGKDSKFDGTKDRDRDGGERQRRSKDYKVRDQERDPRSGNDKRDKDKGTGKYDSENDDDDRIVKKKAGQVIDNQDGDQKKEPSSRDVKRTDGKDSKFDGTKDRDRDEGERQRRSKDYKVRDQKRDPRSGNDKRDNDKGTGKYDSEDDDRIVKKKAGQVRDNQDGDQKKEPGSRDVRKTDGKNSSLDDTKDKDRDGTKRQRQSTDYKDDERRNGKYTSKDGTENKEVKDWKTQQGRDRDYKDDDQEREPSSRDKQVKDEKKEDRIREKEHDGDRDYKEGEQEKGPRSTGQSRADRHYTKLNNAGDVDKDGKKIQSRPKYTKHNDQKIELEPEDNIDNVNRSKYDIEGKRGHRTTPMKIQDVYDKSQSTNDLNGDKGANQRIKEESYRYGPQGPLPNEMIERNEVNSTSSKSNFKTMNVHDDVTDQTERLKPKVSESQDDRISFESRVERKNIEQGGKVKEEQKPKYDRAEEYGKGIYHKENESGRSQIKTEQSSEINRNYFDSENREKPDDQERFESKYIYGDVNEVSHRQKSNQRSERKSLQDGENVNLFSSRDGTTSAGVSAYKKIYDDKGKLIEGMETQKSSPNVDIARKAMKIKREYEDGVLDDDKLVGTGWDAGHDRGKRTRIPADDRGQVKYEDGIGVEEGNKKKQTSDQDTLTGEVETGSRRVDRILKSEPYDSQTKMHSEDRPVQDDNFLESEHRTIQKTSFIGQIFGLNEQPSTGQSTSRGQIMQRPSFLEKWFGSNQTKSGKTISHCVKQAKDMKADEGNKQVKLKVLKCGDTSMAETNDPCNVSFIDDNLREKTLHNNCNKIQSLKGCYSWNNDTEIELNQLCSVSKNFLQAYQCMSAENEELKKLCQKLGENFSGKYIDAEKLKKVTMECNELRKKCQSYREMEKKYEALQEKDSCAFGTIKKLSCDLNNRNSIIGNLEAKCRDIQMFYDNKCESISNENEMLQYQIYSLKEELFASKCALNNVDSLRRENSFLSNEVQKLEAALHDSDSQYKCLMRVIEELGGDKDNFPKLPPQSDNNYSNGAGNLEDVAYFTKAVLLGIKNRLKDGGDFDTNAETIDNIKKDCKKSLEDVQEDCRRVCCQAMDKVHKLMEENEYLKKTNFQMLNENNCLVEKLKSNDCRINTMCDQLNRLDKELCVNAKQTADLNSSLNDSATLIKEIENYQMKNQLLEEATRTEQCKIIKELEEKLELNNKILLDCQTKNEMYKKITDEAGLKLDHSKISNENQCSPYGFIGVNISKKEQRTPEGYQMDVTGVIEMEIVNCEKNVENESPRGLNEMPIYETGEYNIDLDDKEPTVSSNYIEKTDTVTDLGKVTHGSFEPKIKIKSDGQTVPRRSFEHLHKSETDDNEQMIVSNQPEAKMGTFVPGGLSLTVESDSVAKKRHSKRLSSPRKSNIEDKLTSGVAEPGQRDEGKPTPIERSNQGHQVQKSENSLFPKSDSKKEIIRRMSPGEDEVVDSKKENDTPINKDEGTDRKNARTTSRKTDQITDNKNDKDSPKVNYEVTNLKNRRSPSRQRDEVTDNKNQKTPSSQQDEGSDRKNTRTPSRQTDQVTDNKVNKDSPNVKDAVSNRKNTRSPSRQQDDVTDNKNQKTPSRQQDAGIDRKNTRTPSRQTDQVTDNKNDKNFPKVKDEVTNRKNTRRPSRQHDEVTDTKNTRRPSRQQDEVTESKTSKNSPRVKADNKKDKGSNVRELPESSGEKNKPKSGKSPRKSIENSERDVDIAKKDRKNGPGRSSSIKHSARDYRMQDSPDLAKIFKENVGSPRTRCELDKKCVSRDGSYRKNKGFTICDLGYDKLLKPLPACLGGGSGQNSPCAAMRMTYLSKLNMNNCGKLRSSSDTDCSEKILSRCKTKGRKKGGQELFESDGEDNNAYENFVKVHALFLNEKIKHGENVQQVLKVILNALMEECGFCFCKNLIPKGKFYVICHKILHRGIQNIQFKELIYLHGKIVKLAESLKPGELISYIQHNFSIKNNSVMLDVLSER